MHILYDIVLIYLVALFGIAYNYEMRSFLGNVINYVFNAADKVQVIQNVFNAAVEEECTFKCSNGAHPVPNMKHIATSDGCGALSLKIKSDYLPFASMEECCNLHDICYDTCNKKKDICDQEFKRCLYKICNEYKIEAFITACKGTAKMLHTGTLALGCKFYLDSQENACYCSKVNSYWESKQRDYRSYNKPRNEF